LKILVLNGSPKGNVSVTMQYVHYIQERFPEHELEIVNISQKIEKIEKESQIFQDILDKIRFSDAVIWASPVYYLLVPANYKRFIELIFIKNATTVFNNKYTAFLTTSIHFFDHTAHNYMNAICDDLNMRYIGSFSAAMYDLTKSKEKQRLYLFAQNFFQTIKEQSSTAKTYLPLVRKHFVYQPDTPKIKIDLVDKKMVVVSDAKDSQDNLTRMIERFKAPFSGNIETVNLCDLDIKGACLGCIKCGYDNKCVYEDQDEFIDFYKTTIKTADILVWAGTITDRYLSARWKTYFDRSFFSGHAPSISGKQVGFLISGPLSQLPNLRQVLEGYLEVQHANSVGFVTDEPCDSLEIDHMLQTMGKQLVEFAENGYIKPATFLGVGGNKIFRDDIYGQLRFPFRADHLTYKKLGVYDFPQKNYKNRIQNTIMLLMSKIPAFRKEVNKRMKEEMIKPLQKQLKKID
jgi:multimeric flavodoxin WrbA